VTGSLELPFRWNGAEGVVQVEVGIDDDPDRFGIEEFARGFPYCRATIAPLAAGYGEILGWVQLVERSDLDPGFNIDIFEPLGEVPHPFAFFGFSPTLFDAPHTTLQDWDFTAHSFLCGLGGRLFEQTEGGRREVRPLLGFEWGFSKRETRIDAFGPKPLPVDAWNGHLSYLRGRFTAWSFAAGFFEQGVP
jgi:hypothetical protein